MYVYPNLGRYDLYIVRLFGSGLGNLLFPWARAVIAARELDCEFIQPTWPQLKVGTLYRREMDCRFYTGLFEPHAEAITGIRRLRFLLTHRRIPEQAFTRFSIASASPSCVVEFRGLGKYFQPLLSDRLFIYEKLLQITKKEHLKGCSYDFSGAITLHVRLGDFKVGNLTTPLCWYVNVVNSLRSYLGSCLKVFVFSDGSDFELEPLLGMPYVERLSFGSSIGDLLAMANSKVLVGPNHSTFSRWAAFLGAIPSVWPCFEERLQYSRSTESIYSEDGLITVTDAEKLLARLD